VTVLTPVRGPRVRGRRVQGNPRGRTGGRSAPTRSRKRFARRVPSSFKGYQPVPPRALAPAATAARAARNFPLLAVALALLLAGLLLDPGEGDGPAGEVTDWGPLVRPPSDPPDPGPEWWPTGSYTGGDVQGGYLRIRGQWLHVAIGPSGEPIWTRHPAKINGERGIAIGPGINLSVKVFAPNPRQPLLTSRHELFNTNSAGITRQLAEVVSYGDWYFQGFSTSLAPFPGIEPEIPYPPYQPDGPVPEQLPRPVPDPSPSPSRPLPSPSPRPAPPRPMPVEPLPSPPLDPAPAGVPRPVPRRTVPLPARSPAPARTPVADRGTLPSGMPMPVPAPLGVPTPVWQEVPWPGGPVIGNPAQRPPATPEGIAAELGRLESKVASIGGAPGLDVPGLLEAIGSLIPGPADYRYPAGEYTLPTVCDRDDEGRLLPPKRAAWPAGTGEIGELRAKVDALAKLIRFHKEWKQPICPPERSRPLGAPVTVTFEEVPPAAQP
jgi:hypothetical protein